MEDKVEDVLLRVPLHFLSSAEAIVIAVFGKGQTGLVVANEEDDGEKGEEDV